MTEFRSPPSPHEEGKPADPWHSTPGDQNYPVLKNLYRNLFAPNQQDGANGGYEGVKGLQGVLRGYHDGTASWNSTVANVNSYLKNYNRPIGLDGNPEPGSNGDPPNLSNDQIALLYRLLVGDAFNSRIAPFPKYMLW